MKNRMSKGSKKKKVPLTIVGESFVGKVKKKAIVQYLLNKRKIEE